MEPNNANVDPWDVRDSPEEIEAALRDARSQFELFARLNAAIAEAEAQDAAERGQIDRSQERVGASDVRGRNR